MRFLVNGEQNRQMLLNTVVLLFLVYMVLLWVSMGLMYFHRMSLDPQSVIEFYLGSEARFTEPRSYQSMLEVSHAHMFSMGMLAVTLTHLLLLSNASARLKIGLSLTVFFSTIADECAGWLVRFAHPLFAWFKIGSFLVMEASLGALIILVGVSLWRQRTSIGAYARPQKRCPHSGKPDKPSPRLKSHPARIAARTSVTKA